MAQRSIFSHPPAYGLIGHRGVAGIVPENTLASFAGAHEVGLNWVEFDVQLSLDGHLMLYHDIELQHNTNLIGRISQYTRQELQQAVLSTKYFPHAQTTIPSFEDALQLMAKLNLNINIEIKLATDVDFSQENAHIRAVLDMLERYWPESNTPLISSFNHNVLLSMSQLKPDLSYGYLCHKISPLTLERVKRTKNATLNCRDSDLDLEQLKQLTNEGIKIIVFTVNRIPRALELWQAGAFALFTDFPEALIDLHKTKIS